MSSRRSGSKTPLSMVQQNYQHKRPLGAANFSETARQKHIDDKRSPTKSREGYTSIAWIYRTSSGHPRLLRGSSPALPVPLLDLVRDDRRSPPPFAAWPSRRLLPLPPPPLLLVDTDFLTPSAPPPVPFTLPLLPRLSGFGTGFVRESLKGAFSTGGRADWEEEDRRFALSEAGLFMTSVPAVSIPLRV